MPSTVSYYLTPEADHLIRELAATLECSQGRVICEAIVSFAKDLGDHRTNPDILGLTKMVDSWVTRQVIKQENKEKLREARHKYLTDRQNDYAQIKDPNPEPGADE